MSQSRQLAAIMFTDVVGYTALMGKDETVAFAALQTIRESLQPLVKRFQGKWVKEIGDGTLTSFSSALDAVSCALEFQKILQTAEFKVRIGIHVGDVTFMGKDVYGDGVNIASRIEPLTPPGGIYISGRVNEDIQNHPEIRTQFVGNRKLKNVSRPIKIYALVGEGLPALAASPSTNKVKNILLDLWQRRFPQVMFIYLAMAAFLVLLTKWLLNKYWFSPYWGDFTWVFLLSLLPSVAVVAYYHGKSGSEKWVKAEKVTIPLNLVFTASLLFFLFQGKELGAATQNITVKDEEGREVQLVQAKSEFRKRIALFFFDNQSANGGNSWLSPGIPTALEYDLAQDLFVQAIGPYELLSEINRTKPQKLSALPMTLMRKIARDYRYDHFMAGNYKLENEIYTLNTQLYDTDRGRLLADQSVTGSDLFLLIDQLTLKLKEDLAIPTGRIKSTEDLPVADILSGSLPAYKNLITGFDAIRIDNNYEVGIDYFEKAVEIDDQFTIAYLTLAVSHFYNNKLQLAKKNMEKVMEYLYALPQREQFAAKSLYYHLKQDQAKRLKVLEMWLEFYPDDVDAYNTLGQTFQFSGRLSEAESTYKDAIKKDDNRGNFYVLLSVVLMAQEKSEEALFYLKQYAQQYPDHARSFKLLGDYYFDLGSFNQAKQNYERASLLDPDDVSIVGKATVVQEREGHFEKALEEYHSLLRRCKNTADSIIVVNLLKDYHYNKGEIVEGLRWWDRYLQMFERTQAPVNVSIQKITGLEWYFRVGKSDLALKIIKEEEAKLNESLSDLIAFGYLTYYIEKKDMPRAEAAMQRIQNYVQKFGSPASIELFYEAELHRIKEEHEKAIEKYQAFKPSNLFVPDAIIEIQIALSLWKTGKVDESQIILNRLLRLNPYHPTGHYVLALILLDQNQMQEALKHLEITNQVWEKADTSYQLATEARKKYLQIKSTI